MKFIHLSDLHLGKRVNEFSMIEDQKYILRQIIKITDSENPDAVLIAGDIYDKSVPPSEAVQLFDEFLFQLSERKIQVFIISGNHDCAERIAFGSRLMNQSGIHFSPVYSGKTDPFVMEDSYGSVYFYMLPFVRPANVRGFFEDEKIESYSDAVGAAVAHMNIDRAERNIIITHQFVTGAQRSDSEDISAGGCDNVDVSVFESFDYVALGHIHGPQKIKKDTVRYCGTPLKYSFSEKDHVKSVTVVNMRLKGDVEINTVPLIPKRDMREIKGKYNEITLKSNYENTEADDYLHIILTDEEDIPEAVSRLRLIYPNLMKLDYDNTRTKNSGIVSIESESDKKTELELFCEFYEKQNGMPMSDEQLNFCTELLNQIKEEQE